MNPDQDKEGLPSSLHFARPNVTISASLFEQIAQKQVDTKWQELVQIQDRILESFQNTYRATQQEIMEWNWEMRNYASQQPHLKHEFDRSWADPIVEQYTLVRFGNNKYPRVLN